MTFTSQKMIILEAVIRKIMYTYTNQGLNVWEDLAECVSERHQVRPTLSEGVPLDCEFSQRRHPTQLLQL